MAKHPCSEDINITWRPSVPAILEEKNGFYGFVFLLYSFAWLTLPIVVAIYLIESIYLGIIGKFVIILSASIMMSFGMTLLLAAFHEAAHFSLFKAAWLNCLISVLCTAPLPYPFISRAYSINAHSVHHLYSNTDKDPEHIYPPLKLFSVRWFWNSTVNLIKQLATYQQGSLAILLYKKPLDCLPYNQNWVPIPLRQMRLLIIWEIFICLLVWGTYCFLVISHPVLILIFLLSTLLYTLVSLAGGYLLHVAPPSFYLAPPMKGLIYLSWGVLLHIEHHAFPNVPFYKLFALSRYLKRCEFYEKNNFD